jgi:hypothetical protein
MKRVDWRALTLFLAFTALWWFFTLASRCDGGKPRPAEPIPAEQQNDQE